MSSVWVVQDQRRWDEHRACFVPKFDLKPAEEFGEVKILMSPTATPFQIEETIAELQKKLSEGYRDGDYILLTGNPVLIGLAFAIAADLGMGSINALQWDSKRRAYIPIHCSDIFYEE